MWKIGLGGVELSVRHYAVFFGEKRKSCARSLRPSGRAIFEGTALEVSESESNGWRLYCSYFRYCRAHRQDIFHLMNAGPIVLLITLLSGVKKVVYHIRGTKYWKKGYDIFYKKPLWWLTTLFPVMYLANSNYSASVFHRKVLPVQPRVIYNGFDCGRFTEKKSLRQSLRRMGYAGRFYKGKNVELLLRLFDAAAANRPDLELLLAGDGPLRPELEALAANSPYRGRIRFLGYVEDMPQFFSSIDLFVFLSAHESFGNVLAEALLTGLPVLTSDLPVFHEIFGEEEGFVLGDPTAFETLKKRFLESIDRFDILAKKAFDQSEEIEQRFDIQHHLSAIEQIYENL